MLVLILLLQGKVVLNSEESPRPKPRKSGNQPKLPFSWKKKPWIKLTQTCPLQLDIILDLIAHQIWMAAVLSGPKLRRLKRKARPKINGNGKDARYNKVLVHLEINMILSKMLTKTGDFVIIFVTLPSSNSAPLCIRSTLVAA